MSTIKNRVVGTIILLLCCGAAIAVKAADSSSVRLNIITAHFTANLPLGDLAKRFGFFNNGGIQYLHKTKSNFLIGARGLYTFGSNIKEPNALQNLGTITGGTINNNGIVGLLRVYQRGYYAGVDFGKIFITNKKNANSGLFTLTSIGFVQHKIHIFDRENEYPQLSGNYIKGYDRLTQGWYVDEMLGYMYFSKNKKISLFGGLNFNYASTKGQRPWWFDVQKTGLDKRNDMNLGAVVGWMIPIYPRKVDQVYY